MSFAIKLKNNHNKNKTKEIIVTNQTKFLSFPKPNGIGPIKPPTAIFAFEAPSLAPKNSRMRVSLILERTRSQLTKKDNKETYYDKQYSERDDLLHFKRHIVVSIRQEYLKFSLFLNIYHPEYIKTERYINM